MEAKTRGGGGPGVKLLLFVSFLLNALLLSLVFLTDGPYLLGWSREAAAEAEAVATISCSGHGYVYLDSLVVDGRRVCECNTCYGGDDCSVLLPDCPADADSGNPLFLEPYWRKHATSSAVVVSGWHRMSYRANGDNYLSIELDHHIRLLHQAVGNAVTQGRFILFGAGSTQLINAAVFALSQHSNASSPASVVATAPYYPLYKQQTNLFDYQEYEWKGITSNWINRSISHDGYVIEFVTSPNNPDGRMYHSVLGGSAAVHDHAYYWPHFAAITAPADEDLMLFTISKLSGHASSRLGWAVVKDEVVYQDMVTYLGANTMGVSRDTQLRMLQIVKSILAKIGGEDDILRFGPKTMSKRWRKLNEVVSKTSRFSLQELSPQYCNYFKKIRDPSPAYGWLKCKEEGDGDCAKALEDIGIISRSGTFFEGGSRYTRLSLIKRQDDFDQLIQRFEGFISKQVVDSI